MRARGCKDANRDKAAKDAHAKVDAKEALRGYTVRDHLDARRTKLCNLGQFLAVEIRACSPSCRVSQNPKAVTFRQSATIKCRKKFLLQYLAGLAVRRILGSHSAKMEF